MYLLIKFIFPATKPTSCKQCNAIRITKITNIKPKDLLFVLGSNAIHAMRF